MVAVVAAVVVVVVVLDDDGVEDEGSERRIAKSRTRNRMNLPAQPFILRSAVVLFDQFIQGFKTFLGARPPWLCFVARFFFIRRSPPLLFSSRSLFRHVLFKMQLRYPASRERNFLRR